jgi:hypothetical protein
MKLPIKSLSNYYTGEANILDQMTSISYLATNTATHIQPLLFQLTLVVDLDALHKL